MIGYPEVIYSFAEPARLAGLKTISLMSFSLLAFQLFILLSHATLMDISR
jgi:hypothetical protein